MSTNPRFAVRTTIPLVRTTAITLLCGLALLLGAGTAAAHTRLLGSDPADGARLDTAPQRVSLEFNEAMQPDFSTITVVGPDGAEFQTGAVTADGRVVSTGVSPLGAAGRYEIGYRVISEDGHPVTGSVAFTLTTPGPTSATPEDVAPTTATAAPALPTDDGGDGGDRDGGMPVWPWVVGAVVLVGGGIGAALRLGR